MLCRRLTLVFLAPVVAWTESTCGSPAGQCDHGASECEASLLQGRRAVSEEFRAEWGPPSLLKLKWPTLSPLAFERPKRAQKKTSLVVDEEDAQEPDEEDMTPKRNIKRKANKRNEKHNKQKKNIMMKIKKSNKKNNHRNQKKTKHDNDNDNNNDEQKRVKKKKTKNKKNKLFNFFPQIGKWVKEHAKKISRCFKGFRKLPVRGNKVKKHMDKALSKFPSVLEQVEDALPLELLSESHTRALYDLGPTIDKIASLSKERDKIASRIKDLEQDWKKLRRDVKPSRSSLIQGQSVDVRNDLNASLADRAAIKYAALDSLSGLTSARTSMAKAKGVIDGLMPRLEARSSQRFDSDFTSNTAAIPSLRSLKSAVANLMQDLSNLSDVDKRLGQLI